MAKRSKGGEVVLVDVISRANDLVLLSTGIPDIFCLTYLPLTPRLTSSPSNSSAPPFMT